MGNWKEELELIDNLGLLYPELRGWVVYNKNWENDIKAWWVYGLCVYHLKQRMPQLEEFIKYYSRFGWWKDYKEHFSIK